MPSPPSCILLQIQEHIWYVSTIQPLPQHTKLSPSWSFSLCPSIDDLLSRTLNTTNQFIWTQPTATWAMAIPPPKGLSSSTSCIWAKGTKSTLRGTVSSLRRPASSNGSAHRTITGLGVLRRAASIRFSSRRRLLAHQIWVIVLSSVRVRLTIQVQVRRRITMLDKSCKLRIVNERCAARITYC